jgi:hypothetical protein
MPPPFVNASALVAASILAGCSSGLERIDRAVAALVAESTTVIGADVPPDIRHAAAPAPTGDPAAYPPPTVNPRADELSFDTEAVADAVEVMRRLEGYNVASADATSMDITGVLAYAADHAREFRFEEEEFVLAALRLLIERHQWGPRFFDDVSALLSAAGDDGLYDSSLNLVNEFRITQRLPYGGEISATALARATEDLHQRVAGEEVSSAEVIIAADVPLLRGAGLVAREGLIQQEREMVYAARTFERFRREFLFDIARDYLDLVVLHRRIENATRNVDAFQKLEAQQKALQQAGRSTPFDTAEAQNETLEAIDRLNRDRESERLALDRFKVRIGMPVDAPLAIAADSFGLPVPRSDIDGAVRTAMMYRLDLQTQRDRLDDARRAVDNARNALLGDLDLTASATIPTDDTFDRASLRFEPEDTRFAAGVTYGLPLDREIERAQLRQAEIALERSLREYDRFRDEVALSVRSAVRGIDSALFSFGIQERNVEIAEQRVASIEADPARADIRQKTDAINQVASARDARDDAQRDLEVAILLYLLETDQLRVEADGRLRLLPGMPGAGAPDGEAAGGGPGAGAAPETE